MKIGDYAPAWMKRSFGIGFGSVPLNDVFRSAVTVPLVLGATEAIAGSRAAIFAGLAAMLVVLGERSGTTGQRLFKAGAGFLAGTFAMTFGPPTTGTGLVPLAAVAGFAAISGVLSSFGAALSFAGMQLLVQMSIAGGLNVPISQTEKLTAYIAGGLAALAGVWIQSTLEHTEKQYGENLHAVIAALKLWCRSIPSNWTVSCSHSVRLLRHQVDTRLAEASDLILTARPLRKARRQMFDQLRVARDKVSVLVCDVFSSRLPPDPESLSTELSISDTRFSCTESTKLIPIRTLVAQSLSARSTWVYVLRLVLCMMLGELARQITPLGHPYWILLTIALVLKPDLASVFSRSLQRGFGTAVGLLIGWSVMVLAPSLFILLAVFAVLSAAIPYTVRRNYAWFSVIVTPLVFILLDFGGPLGIDVLVQRLVHTLTGCAIVLIAGYALWPDTWRPTARPQIARICEALAAFVDQSTFRDEFMASVLRADARLAIARDIAALRARAEQAVSEPEPMRTRAHHWNEVTEALDDVLVAATLHDQRHGRDDVTEASGALRLLAERLRDPDRALIRSPLTLSSHVDLAKRIAALAAALGHLRLYGEH